MKPPSEVTCESNHVARSTDVENGLPGGNSIKRSEESKNSTNGSPTETEASSNNAANAPQSVSTEEGIEGDDNLHINGKKRVLQESAPDSGKKPKLIFPDESTKSNDNSVELNINSIIGEKEKSLYELYLQKSFKGLSKQIFKEILVQKFCETFAYNSCIGELRTRAAQLEDENQRLNKISNTLRKQLSDSKHIIKRLLEERDTQIRSGRTYPLTPLRVTRSVGLQVCTSGTFLMRPKSLSKPSQNDKVIDLVSGEQSGVGKTASAPSKESNEGTKALNGSEIQENNSRENGGPPSALLVDMASTTQESAFSTKSTFQSSSALPMVSQQPKSLASILAWTPTTLPQMSSQTTRASWSSGKSEKPPEVTQKVEQAIQSQPKVHVPLPNSPHYIIASPISSQANKTTVVNQVNQVDRLKPLDKPKTVERAKQDKLVTTNNAMEVIDLTEKDEKVLLNKTPNVLPPVSISSATSTQPVQLSNNIKVQKKQETNSTLDMAKPGKFSNSGNSENYGDILNEKEDSSLIESVSKLPPLPTAPKDSLASGPPRPFLRICKSSAGIMLSWNFGSHKANAEVATFELFAYQERKDNCPKVWNKVGEVKALPLPMACTLTQFVDGQKYHFAVRAIDVNDRIGEFSAPGSIVLNFGDHRHE